MACLEVQGPRVPLDVVGSLVWMANQVVLGSLASKDHREKMEKTVSLVHLGRLVSKGLLVWMDTLVFLAKQAQMDNPDPQALLVSVAVRDSLGLQERLVQLVSLALQESRATMNNLGHLVLLASRVVKGSRVHLAFLVKLDSLGLQGDLGKTEAMDNQGRQEWMGTLACQAHLVEMVQWVKQGCRVFQALLANRLPQRSVIIPHLRPTTAILENSHS